MPNGCLDYKSFAQVSSHAIGSNDGTNTMLNTKLNVDNEKLKKIKSIYASNLVTSCAPLCIGVNEFKEVGRKTIKKMWEQQK